jgi:hypothetical protein
MTGHRLSIAGMLGFIAIAGFCLAAMRSSSPLWTAVGTTLGLGILLTAVLGAVFLRGDSRAFASGFALFGSVYLLLVNWDWIGAQIGRDLTAGLGDLVERVVFPVDPAKKSNYFNYETLQQRQHRIGNFLQIGRLAFSLFFGLAGGLIARAMAASSRPRPGPPNDRPGASNG